MFEEETYFRRILNGVIVRVMELSPAFSSNSIPSPKST